MADEKSRNIEDRPEDELAKMLDEYPNDLHNDLDDMPSPAAPKVTALSQWRVATCLLRLRRPTPTHGATIRAHPVIGARQCTAHFLPEPTVLADRCTLTHIML